MLISSQQDSRLRVTISAPIPRTLIVELSPIVVLFTVLRLRVYAWFDGYDLIRNTGEPHSPRAALLLIALLLRAVVNLSVSYFLLIEPYEHQSAMTRGPDPNGSI